MPGKGILLLNLGSPRAPNKKAVGEYLNEFLMDPYVIDLPWVARWPLVHGVITPFRAEKSAEAFRKIWRADGSPLVQFTKAFAEQVRQTLQPQLQVRWSMRYGDPSIAETVTGWEIDQIDLVPLYPQYAESSTRSAVEFARAEIAKVLPRVKVRALHDFYAAAEFIEAQSRQISDWARSFKPDHILMSFHGLPEHHMTKLYPEHCLRSANCCDRVGDNNRNCYRAQALATGRAVSERLDYKSEQISLSFQSRLGRRPWIKPYTDIVIDELAAMGRKRILVACPSFVADCLETLEEIQIRLREQFLNAGGKELLLAPALNAEPHWVKGFSQMVQRPDLDWQP